MALKKRKKIPNPPLCECLSQYNFNTQWSKGEWTLLEVIVYLFAIVCDWGQDGAQCLKPHGDVEQMCSKEEVVIVTQDGHGHVPGQIQEGLHRGRGAGESWHGSGDCSGCVSTETCTCMNTHTGCCNRFSYWVCSVQKYILTACEINLKLELCKPCKVTAFLSFCIWTLTLSVKTTPSFQIWYLTSMEFNLLTKDKDVWVLPVLKGHFSFEWSLQGRASSQGEWQFINFPSQHLSLSSKQRIDVLV